MTINCSFSAIETQPLFTTLSTGSQDVPHINSTIGTFFASFFFIFLGIKAYTVFPLTVSFSNFSASCLSFFPPVTETPQVSFRFPTMSVIFAFPFTMPFFVTDVTFRFDDFHFTFFFVPIIFSLFVCPFVSFSFAALIRIFSTCFFPPAA